MADRIRIGRLAMRVEGDNWNAYLAEPGTMEGAVLLGSIKLSAVKSNMERRQDFIALMRKIASDLIRDMTGVIPSFGEPVTAPKDESSDHG